MRKKTTMSIGTAVSFDGSLKKDYKIVALCTNGSTVTVISLANGARDGMSYTPNLLLRQTLERNGCWETKATKESGNDFK